MQGSPGKVRHLTSRAAALQQLNGALTAAACQVRWLTGDSFHQGGLPMQRFMPVACMTCLPGPAGEVRYLTSGASPISPEVFEFLRICFSATVIEGYGMTETSCTIALTRPGDPIMGHVGPPLPCVELKLEDIPEMGYTNKDQPYPRGEVGAPACSLLCRSHPRAADVSLVDGVISPGRLGRLCRAIAAMAPLGIAES